MAPTEHRRVKYHEQFFSIFNDLELLVRLTSVNQLITLTKLQTLDL